MVNCDSLREQLPQIDKNHPDFIPTWLIILITVLGTIMTGARFTVVYAKLHSFVPRLHLYSGIKRTIKKLQGCSQALHNNGYDICCN